MDERAGHAARRSRACGVERRHGRATPIMTNNDGRRKARAARDGRKPLN
ncbi:hypothetical protein BSIN_5162 [Burkholderia singularis]|uniref:Uncharacterized protein n=1 Tax=Burkholderia singularis TaxID=1503053 RepID=A0A238HBX0_9BURK|nr:hypothetical protein BSIN_5162 [Burkholderia singularis]